MAKKKRKKRSTSASGLAKLKFLGDRYIETCAMMVPGYDPVATAGDCWFDHEAARHSVEFFADSAAGSVGHARSHQRSIRPVSGERRSCLLRHGRRRKTERRRDREDGPETGGGVHGTRGPAF